jgi:integrase
MRRNSMPHLQLGPNNSYSVRWREQRIVDGKMTTVHTSKPLGKFGSAAEARKAMVKMVVPATNPQGSILLGEFIHNCYLPHVTSRLRASTVYGYTRIAAEYPWPTVTLNNFRTVDGERFMEQAANGKSLSKNTLHHIKCFLSGVFKYAKRIGVLDVNPMQDVSLPKAKQTPDTYAYSPEELQVILSALSGEARLAVAIAGYTGLRKSEIAGLKWEDYSDGMLHVRRAKWRESVDEPKTRKSQTPVPVIPQLAGLLETYPVIRIGWVIATPIERLTAVAITPKLGEHWHGWHAFRRGLATNLKQQGVDDLTIQAILRHSDVRTTQNCYIKILRGDTVAAMGKLAEVIQMPERRVG